jgi:signal transduction histidine kinase
MLGRQQIAGAATAISELFKNAHDAYATRVEVDYYRPENIFLLRDNGTGMTLDEFKDRWLTLGTESKIGAKSLYRPAGMEERPVMGEKGIGRLAIARIGPQVLVMTRAFREDSLHDLVVGLVNWELFELPGINLDEIEIPVETCPMGTLPDAKMVKHLADQLRSVVRSLGRRASTEQRRAIDVHLTQLTADPRRLDVFFNSGDASEPDFGPLSLRNEGCGTHFLIQPADVFLGEELQRDERPDTDPAFAKFLVGFANTMVPGSPPPRLSTRFRDWRFTETATELIAGGAFITSDDFVNADHHFSGEFDEFGQFTGTVRIYDAPPVRHSIAWEGAAGSETICGPFTINLAYLQGAARESHLSPEDHAVLYQKLNRFGGLYVYKDGIRVLPYGNSDFDWLNIETRRNKGSAYYFFAYRRMFGAVEISQSKNPALVEKAGREGFQLNRAYRQFTEILENFFVQLAADFFRDSGVKSTLFSERKSELERLEFARRKREESVSGKRRAFAANLESFFKLVDNSNPQTQVSTLFDDVKNALDAAGQERSKDRAAALLIDAEAFAEHKMKEIRRVHTVSRPRDVGLSTSLRRDWEAYLAEKERLESDVFEPASRKLHSTIGVAAKEARVLVDQRKRLQTLINELAVEVEKDIQAKSSEAKKIAEEKQKGVSDLARTAVISVRDCITSIQTELQRSDFEKLSASAIEKLREGMERKINDAAKQYGDVLENARQQLSEIVLDKESGGEPLISSGEITGAIEEEVLALREAADADAELVQLGMALAIVTHEFDAVIRTIRDQLKRLKGWANASPQLRPIYERITGSFEHLDGYLALFTPLQRRLYRSPQKISGSEITKFLDDLFSARLSRHKVTLEASSDFSAYSVVGYPSTFFPVFVNIVDNAIYWLRDYRGERTIRLDADTGGMTISNSGPKIAARDKEAIFDLRFTRKPGGRGMGLYISRQTLARAGYRLHLDRSERWPVCFRIAPHGESAEKENTSEQE